MNIKWYGHSAFLIETSDGTRILTDPCAPTTGYDLHDIPCDIVISSHSHFDHNYFVAAAGTPQLVTQAGGYEFGSVKIKTLPCFHDEQQGALRGPNLISVIEADGLRLVHMGDLGHQLTPELIEGIGMHPDVVFCPVGGVFTVDAEGACSVLRSLHPTLIFPMHYQTDALTLSKPLLSVEEFLRRTKSSDIQRQNACECVVTKDTLPAHCRVIVLNYAGKARA